jgi:PAS domain S-box-containing protein
MRDSRPISEKPVEKGGKSRARKAQLEHVNHHKIVTKKTLEGLKDLYWSIMENAYIGIAQVDIDYKITMTNNAMGRYFHKPVCELVGKQCFQEFEKRTSVCSHCPGTKAMKTGRLEEAETEGVRDDGSRVPVRLQAFPTIGPDGTMTGFIELIEDITERKKAEEELRESEEKYRDLFENAGEGIITVDLEARITGANKLVEEYGFKREELFRKKLFDFVPEYDWARSVSDFEILVSGKSVNGEMDVITPKGIFTVEYRDNPIIRAGKVIGVQIILTDITERKRAEESLRESEERFRRLYEQAPLGYQSLDAEGCFIDVNQAWLDLLGYSRDQVIGRCFGDFLAPQEVKAFRQRFTRFKATGEVHVDLEMVQRDGSTILVHIDGRIGHDEHGQFKQTHCILYDITERKRAEQLLRRERDKAQKYLDVAAVIMVAIDAEQRVGLINKKGCQILGYSEDEILGKNWFNNFLPERIRSDVKGKFKRVLSGQSDVSEYYENPVLTKSGEERLIAWHNTVLRDEKGQVIAALNSGEDITERKQAEEALAQERNLLRALMDNIPDNIYFKDRESRFIRTTKSHAKWFGLSDPAGAIGKTDFDFFSDDHAHKAYEDEQEIIRTGQPLLNIEERETWPDRPDTWVLTSKMPLCDEKGKIIGTFGISRDITERKRAEKKLLDYQGKLKSLASQLTLAEERERRRIATELHDQIGQSLAISKVKLDGLRHNVCSEDPSKVLADVCGMLGHAIANLRSLTFDLSSPILHELGFEAAVAAWLTEEIEQKYGIEVELDEDKKPKPLDEDIKTLLFRDVRELLINVVKHSKATKVKISIHCVGDKMHVGVEDNGIGFDPAEVAAKSVKEGGFGLFSIRERLEQLGGHLEIESAPGRGCKIIMKAPLKQKPEVHLKNI